MTGFSVKAYLRMRFFNGENMKIAMLSVLVGAVMMTGCASVQRISGVGHAETPLAHILKLKPELKNELVTTEIRQYFDKAESPTVGVVKVTETNLMDDSVKTIRTIYNFNLVQGKWMLAKTSQEYQCHRAKNKTKFQTAKCP